MKSKLLWLVVFSVVIVCSAKETRCRRREESGGQCGPGQYLDKAKSSVNPLCEPCPNNTFMDQDKHECESCIDCSSYTSQHKENHLTVAAKCTPTNDTHFHCEPGYHESSISEPDHHKGWPWCVENITPEQAITATSVAPVGTTDTQKPMPNSARTVDPRIHGETSDNPKETLQFNSTDIPAESNAEDNDTGVIVGVAVSGLLLIVIVVILYILKKCRNIRETCLQLCRNLKESPSNKKYTDVSQNDTEV